MTTTEFEVSIDTYLNSISPTNNYGSDTTIQVGGVTGKASGDFRSIFHLDMSSIAGETIDSCDLIADITTSSGTGSGAWYLRRMTTTDFVEGQATWNIYSTGNNWSTAGGDYTTTGQQFFGGGPFSVADDTIIADETDGIDTFFQTDLDGSGHSYFILMQNTRENWYNYFATKEHGTKSGLRLSVTYTPSGGGVPTMVDYYRRLRGFG